MRKFKIKFKDWNKEYGEKTIMIDIDLGMFPDMLKTTLENMMDDFDIDEILEIKNEGSVTREEYETWLTTEDGKYFMSL